MFSSWSQIFVIAHLLGGLSIWVFAERIYAQDTNVTLPVPGEIVPEDAQGRPQLFFDARSTGFGRDGKQQVFDGDVIAIGPRSIVTADRVIVDQEKHQLTAEGHVVIVVADQILTGDKIDYLLDSGDLQIISAQMMVNDKNQAEKIAQEVLGFTIAEIEFESHRKSRISEINQQKEQLKSLVRKRAKYGSDASSDDISFYARLLEQEDLINRQTNPAFAHMSEARRNTLKKRRDFWEKSRQTSTSIPTSKGSYFRLNGDMLSRTNGNDFAARHSLWTPCYCEADESPAWGIRASRTDVQMGGYATFQDAMVEIKGVPILYLPWLMLPVKDRRQSGLLPPTFSDDPISGNGYSQPLFLDLGKDKDITVKGDIFERRGMRAGLDLRWKRREYSGLQLSLEGMRDRIWLRQRSNRHELSSMYREGLDIARATSAGEVGASIPYTGREYTRMRLAQRDWWETMASECLDNDPAVRAQCEEKVFGSIRPPSNVNRGLLKWKAYERISDRLSFVSSGEMSSDRQYNADVYLPESFQTGFESGSGERALSPMRTRINFDGSEYFLGAGSYYGDPARLNDRLEGYQLPLVAQARSRWYLIKEHGQPIYWRAAADDYRIVRNQGNSEDKENQKNFIPGGHWRRAEASFVAPLTNRTTIQVDHFADLELRQMSFDYPSAQQVAEGRKDASQSSLQSWRTGVRFQLPLDGRAHLPAWLGGIQDQAGSRVLHHLMNWSMTLTARPVVRRRGPYGSAQSAFASTPSTWFATDKAGSDDNIPATDFMNEYQIVTFATSHRWKIYSELWKTIVGEESPEAKLETSRLSFEERARRELMYSMDRPVRGSNDLFSEDQTQWFGNRYQLLDTDYIEPLNLGISISYDRLKAVRQKREGKTRDNRAWSELDSSMSLSLLNWTLNAGSKYNVYDKVQTKFSGALIPPGFFRTNISLGYTIERTPIVNSTAGVSYVSTIEKTINAATSLLDPLTASWSYSRKEKENDNPKLDYRQKLSLVYGSASGCWGIGFSREKPYGRLERDASYLLQFNMTFMGESRLLPNMSTPLEREIKKS